MSRGRWGLALWYAVVAFYWFDATHATVERTLDAQLAPAALMGLTLLGLAGRFASQCLEALFYAVAGRAYGTRVRFLPMLGAIATLSLADAMAANLAPPAADASVTGAEIGGWRSVALTLLAGFRVQRGFLADEPGLRFALGSLGLLALARIAGTVFAQRRQGVPLGRACALTGAAVGVGRLLTWWTTDLARGMSPLP